MAPEGAILLLSYSGFFSLSRAESWERQAGRKETERAIDRATHKQRRALGDRKQRPEKDTQTEEGLRAMTEA